MKFHPGPWSVAAGALLSFVLAGCNPPVDEKKMEPPPAEPGAAAGPTPKTEPAPEASKPEMTKPEMTKPEDKPAQPSATSSDAAKPVDSAPAPKDDPKKEETPK